MINRLKPKSEFSKNVLTLMTGTTIAQAIPIAISPILTRIYTPEDFGIFALYMSMASIIAVMATGRYELAIILPKKDEDAVNIVVLSIVIAFFVSFISFLIVFIFNSQITNLLGNPEISNWLYFIPVTVLLTGIYQNLNYWSNRKKQYKRLATSRVIQSGTTATTNLGMGFAGLGSSGLILGGVLGQGVAIFILSKIFFLENNKLQKINRLKIFILLKRYIKFPKFILPTSLLDLISLKIPIFTISILSNNISLLGQYALVERILSLPMGILGSSIGQNFYQEFSDKINKNKYIEAKQLLFKIWKNLFLIGIIPAIIITIYGESIFTSIFGDKWLEAGNIASILIWFYMFQFVSSPTSSAFLVLKLERLSLVFGITVLVYRLIIFIFINDTFLAFKIYVLAEIVQIFIYNFIIVQRINRVYRQKKIRIL